MPPSIRDTRHTAENTPHIASKLTVRLVEDILRPSMPLTSLIDSSLLMLVSPLTRLSSLLGLYICIKKNGDAERVKHLLNSYDLAMPEHLL